METANLEHLLDFDYSVRVNLSHSSLCGDRQQSVTLKLRLTEDDGSERQVVLELDDKQLTSLLHDIDCIHQQLINNNK
uniref:COMM domain-containing protein n=1 Tax=Peronospora matthiolae TaxID=2874970 RepID=A0AAV1TH24_9STRA